LSLALATFGTHDGAVGALPPGDDDAAAATALLDEAVHGRQGANDDDFPSRVPASVTSATIRTGLADRNAVTATTATTAAIIVFLDGDASSATAESLRHGNSAAGQQGENGKGDILLHGTFILF
jgi:hypothetical protein